MPISLDELLALREPVPARYQYKKHSKPTPRKTKAARAKRKAAKRSRKRNRR